MWFLACVLIRSLCTFGSEYVEKSTKNVFGTGFGVILLLEYTFVSEVVENSTKVIVFGTRFDTIFIYVCGISR